MMTTYGRPMSNLLFLRDIAISLANADMRNAPNTEEYERVMPYQLLVNG